MFLLHAITGLLLADLVSAFIHWAQDNLGSEDTPILGHVIRDGRRHHDDPMLFTRSSVLARSWLPFTGAALFFTASVLVIGPTVILTTASIAGALLIEIQVLAHVKTPPKTARILQYLGVIQRPEQHARHHTDEQKSYAVITNWLNPALDASGIWPALARYVKR